MHYDILFTRPDTTPAGVQDVWVLTSNTNRSLGTSLFQILNELAKNGWRVVATGDFALSSRSEILLAHD